MGEYLLNYHTVLGRGVCGGRGRVAYRGDTVHVKILTLEVGLLPLVGNSPIFLPRIFLSLNFFGGGVVGGIGLKNGDTVHVKIRKKQWLNFHRPQIVIFRKFIWIKRWDKILWHWDSNLVD